MGSALTSLSASGETDTHIFFLVLPCALLLQQGFLNLSTTDTWGWMLPCWWREWGQGACEGVKDGVGSVLFIVGGLAASLASIH